MDNNNVIIGGSKYDVPDITKYSYLNPIWKILNNIPDKGITSKKLFEQTKLDEKQANILVREMIMVFQNSFMKELKNPIKMMFKFGKKDFYEKNLANCWVFDKLMLLGTKIDTGNPNVMDNNPFMAKFKQKWNESRGT